MSVDAKNSIYTKTFNRLQLLRFLRHEPLSRSTLSRLTGLTRAAISLITEELISEGIIRESSLVVENGSRGRTPILLELCPDAYYAVGIHLNRRRCRIGICDFVGNLLLETRIPISSSTPPQEVLDAVTKQVRALMTQTGIPKEKFLGIGVAAPGPVDVAAGRILNPPNFVQWKNYPIAAELTARTGLPVYLENDANAAALHNYTDYDFPGKENFLLILLLDNGTGSGVISEGKLLRTGGGYTCELGHTSIDFRGPRCSCGNRGCLEVYASPNQLLKFFPEYESFVELMNSPSREKALQMEAEFLSAAILNFSNLVRIDTVLLDGEILDHAKDIIPMIEEKLQGKPLSLGDSHLRVLQAARAATSCVQAACNVAFCSFLDIC